MLKKNTKLTKSLSRQQKKYRMVHNSYSYISPDTLFSGCQIYLNGKSQKEEEVESLFKFDEEKVIQ